METAALCDRPVAVRAGEELDERRLSAFLSAHLGGHGPVLVEQFPSGHSNLTYSLKWGTREMVLRRPPFGSRVKSAHDMGREYHVLSKLHEAYPFAPRVILYCDDASVLGTTFYLMEPIRGVILRKELPTDLGVSTATARLLSEAFLDNLVRLHRLDYAKIGLGDLGKPEGYLERQVKGWIDRYQNSATHELSDVGRICSWLTQHIPKSGPPALIHNDYKYDNVVLDPDDITKIIGVLDWEMCTVGDPLTDLGTTLAYWTDPDDTEEIQKISAVPTTTAGTLTRAELVQRYAATTGRDVSNIAFYVAFARFKVAVIIQQIYYRYAQGLTQDERFAALPHRVAVLMRASFECLESGRI